MDSIAEGNVRFLDKDKSQRLTIKSHELKYEE